MSHKSTCVLIEKSWGRPLKEPKHADREPVEVESSWPC
jgi:hypothetical protein